MYIIVTEKQGACQLFPTIGSRAENSSTKGANQALHQKTPVRRGLRRSGGEGFGLKPGACTLPQNCSAKPDTSERLSYTRFDVLFDPVRGVCACNSCQPVPQNTRRKACRACHAAAHRRAAYSRSTKGNASRYCSTERQSSRAKAELYLRSQNARIHSVYSCWPIRSPNISRSSVPCMRR